jgi:pantoate--beta-alanine ligase
MGALHDGHLSLMREARRRCSTVVVSVFVNPTQFGPHEDLERYPRDLEGDARLCAGVGVDLLFAPMVEEVYPPGVGETWVQVEGLTEGLCGRYRPGHFRGVCTVVSRLFLMAQPQLAFFGEKDYQQLAVLRKMTRDLCFPIEIIGVPTVREADGLALSSRNLMLSPAAREQALVLVQSLREGQRLFREGARGHAALLEAMRAVLERAPLAQVQYLELVDPDSLLPCGSTLPERVQALLAVFVGGVRLIDNAALHAPT